MKIELTYNQKLDGIELLFSEKPSSEVREQMRKSGFLWSSTKGIWWAKNSPERKQIAEALLQKFASPNTTSDRTTVAKEQVRSKREPYSSIYKKLRELIADFPEHLAKKSEAAKSKLGGGMMDLNYNYLYPLDNDRHVISLTHYYKMNGDLVPDPDMEIRVDVKQQTAEALAYQDMYKYGTVYSDPYDEQATADKAEQKSQNSFLLQWLKNALSQGHFILIDPFENQSWSEDWANDWDQKYRIALPEQYLGENLEKEAPFRENNALYPDNFKWLCQLIPNLKLKLKQLSRQAKSGQSEIPSSNTAKVEYHYLNSPVRDLHEVKLIFHQSQVNGKTRSFPIFELSINVKKGTVLVDSVINELGRKIIFLNRKKVIREKNQVNLQLNQVLRTSCFQGHRIFFSGPPADWLKMIEEKERGRMEPYSSIFGRLRLLLPDLSIPTVLVAQVASSIIEGLGKSSLHYTFIAQKGLNSYSFRLSEQPEQGKGLPDGPSIEILIDFELRTAEALSIETPAYFEEVYSQKAGLILRNSKVQKVQNLFLIQWLGELLEARHSLKFDLPKSKPVLKQRYGELFDFMQKLIPSFGPGSIPTARKKSPWLPDLGKDTKSCIVYSYWNEFELEKGPDVVRKEKRHLLSLAEMTNQPGFVTERIEATFWVHKNRQEAEPVRFANHDRNLFLNAYSGKGQARVANEREQVAVIAEVFRWFESMEGKRTDFDIFRDVQEGAFDLVVEKENKQEEAKEAKTKPEKQSLNTKIEALIERKDKLSEPFDAKDRELIAAYVPGQAQMENEGKAILYEFYTPMELVKATWDLVKLHGYASGTVLEPSCGIGNFLQFAPEQAQLTGLEINPTTARIAQILYPKANILNKAFESFFFDGNTHLKKPLQKPLFDLVIGSPPNGEFTGKYAGMGEKKWTGASRYEEYFVLRAIDLLRPGGLLAYVLPSLFIRGIRSKAKMKLDEKGVEILDCFRFPNNIFSGTDIGTDLLILKKIEA